MEDEEIADIRQKMEAVAKKLGTKGIEELLTDELRDKSRDALMTCALNAIQSRENIKVQDYVKAVTGVVPEGLELAFAIAFAKHLEEIAHGKNGEQAVKAMFGDWLVHKWPAIQKEREDFKRLGEAAFKTDIILVDLDDHMSSKLGCSDRVNECLNMVSQARTELSKGRPDKA